MESVKENGCLNSALFFLWVGVIFGLPEIIFETSQVGICAIVGFSISLGYIGLSNSRNKYSITNQYCFTLAHVELLVGYIIATIIIIGWSPKVDYNAMKELAQGSLIYLIILIVVFIIEAHIRSKQERKFMEEIKVGDLFEERNAEEKE